jgi:hypothetical protein
LRKAIYIEKQQKKAFEFTNKNDFISTPELNRISACQLYDKTTKSMLFIIFCVDVLQKAVHTESVFGAEQFSCGRRCNQFRE